MLYVTLQFTSHRVCVYTGYVTLSSKLRDLSVMDEMIYLSSLYRAHINVFDIHIHE